MSISTKFRQEFSALSPGGTCQLEIGHDGRELICLLAENNPLAVSLAQLRLESTELAHASMDDLQQLSESLSKRLTYLLEPIAPIEADGDQCVVQMRSTPPQKDDDGRSYYELLVQRGGALSLVRYRKETGDTRQRIPAQLTGEVLVRLVGDLDAALDEFVAK